MLLSTTLDRKIEMMVDAEKAIKYAEENMTKEAAAIVKFVLNKVGKDEEGSN
jgi:hypothetical protein